jgi:hypothetical protein
MWAVVLAAMTCSPVLGGERGRWEPAQPHALGRLAPAGGWHPDGGGLFHWWDPHCFPRCGAPDDYCRKPPPKVCWPPYPPFYIGGPSEVGQPRGICPRGCHEPH